MIDSAVDSIRKMDKAKLILFFSIGMGLTYMYILLQGRYIQKSMVKMINGYTQQQPIDMCVRDITVTHNIFPPKFGATVDYEPCQRDV